MWLSKRNVLILLIKETSNKSSLPVIKAWHGHDFVSLHMCLHRLIAGWSHRWTLGAERRGAKAEEKWRRMRSGCLARSCSELMHVPPFSAPLQIRVVEYLGKTCKGTKRTSTFHTERPELEMNPEPPAVTQL